MLGITFLIVFLLLVWAISLWAGISLWVPAGLTVLALAAVALHFAWKRHKAARIARRIERSLAEQAEAYAGKARPDRRMEVQALQSEFERAVAALKSSKLGRGRVAALYALPWYVIVGPPGVGKSTALRNSGLKFPFLSKRGGVRGIGGTRNCDWWLSNEAVILDTAGRYATQDDDREEWLQFLRMLARARTRRPINGVLLAVSVTEIGGASDDSLERAARQMRERLDEMIEELGTIAPVYVLFTKCDLIPGFVETFEDLRRGERDQVWGMTLNPKELEGDLKPALDHHFEPLVQVLERRALQRGRDQRTVEAREKVLEFPEQFEALLPRLTAFICDVFVRNVYKDTPLLRGVYFTSGTQEGSPVDQVMRSMAAAFGLEAQAAAPPRVVEAKSYFLGELFRAVLFPDSHLARRSSTSLWRGRLTQAGVAGGLVVLALGFSSAALTAYWGNAGLMGRAASSLHEIETLKQADAPIPLRALDPIHGLLSELRRYQHDGAPMRLSWGLYQGDALLPFVQDTYTKTLRDGVVGMVYRDAGRRIQEHLRANQALDAAPGVREHAEVYDLLKAYLLLSEPKEEHEPPLTDQVRSWLSELLVRRWADGTAEPPPPEERKRMASHVGAYLELAAQDHALLFAREGDLVREARALLGRVPSDRLAVDRLVAEIEPLGWDITLDKLLGSSGLPLKGVGRIEGAFTRRAWEAHLRDLLEEVPEGLLGEAWVLERDGGGSDGRLQQARLCSLRSQYFERYLLQWKQFIGSLRMEEPADHARALVVLQDLTRGQPPPLTRVMRAVAYNARLEPKQDEKKEAVAEQTEGVLARLREAVANTPAADLLAKKEPCPGDESIKAGDVRRGLQGFYSFGVAESSDEAAEAAGAVSQFTSVEVYQEQLVFLRDALVTFSDDPGTAEPLLAKLSTARTRVRGLIDSQEVGWRPRFDALLWPPINGTFASSAAHFAGERGSRWCTSVVLPFRRTLEGRFPFAPAGQDAAIADIVEFFHPDSGIIWSFYDATLARDVPRAGDRFELKGGSGISTLYNAELVQFLTRAQQISAVLFPRRAEQPRVDFEVRVRPSPGIASVLLTIDGQTVDFHNGPEKWVPVRWPGGGEDTGAVMRVKGAGIDETLQQQGEWGWFRLLDKSIISAIPNQRFFTARWKLRTQNDVVIDVRPARADNPFVGKKKFLEAFRSEGSAVPERIAESASDCPD